MKKLKFGYSEEIIDEVIEINMDYLAIPNCVLIEKELKANEKMILGLVVSFTNNDRNAFPSNKLLGAILSLSPSRVSSLVSGLVKREYLRITILRNQDGYVIRRYLYPNEKYYPEPYHFDIHESFLKNEDE